MLCLYIQPAFALGVLTIVTKETQAQLGLNFSLIAERVDKEAVLVKMEIPVEGKLVNLKKVNMTIGSGRPLLSANLDTTLGKNGSLIVSFQISPELAEKCSIYLGPTIESRRRLSHHYAVQLKGYVTDRKPPEVNQTVPSNDALNNKTAPATTKQSDESQGENDITWGSGRDVQAGLRARLWATDKHASRFIFDVYLRNCTKETLNVTCPSFDGLSVPLDGVDYTTKIQSNSMYCSPHVRDSKGKKVDVGYHIGTENQQYLLAPGQIALVSHWMLRTMGKSTQTNQKAHQTQVAFVEPGKHRIQCEVSASWGNKGELRKLRTGEASFDVTGADIGGE